MLQQYTISHSRLLPTRQELLEYLRVKGANPEQLQQMSSWEQVQLTKEYLQAMSQ